MPVRAMECDQAGLRVHGQQQRGDVAEAEQDLGIAPDQVVVQIGEHPCASPAATDRENGVHAAVGEETVDVCGAVFVCPAR